MTRANHIIKENGILTQDPLTYIMLNLVCPHILFIVYIGMLGDQEKVVLLMNLYLVESTVYFFTV